MANKILHLIRHAEVGADFRSRYLGRTDVSLSQEGIEQAGALGTELKKDLFPKFDNVEVWISPLKRCQETWNHMANQMTFSSENETAIEKDLVEIDFGKWEGKEFREIVDSDPEEVKKWGAFEPGFSFPGGEALASFQGRMENIRRKILDSKKRELILVTHGGVVSGLLCLFLGLSPSQYIIFQLARPSIATLTLFDNGLGRLSGLRSVGKRKAGEWPG